MESVSVIIPAFNAGDVLGRQLEALAAQDFDQPFEVVIGDNGSTDNTREVGVSFADRFDRLVVIDASAGVGAGGARNIAIANATGSILAFCDSDDVASPSWLRNIVAPLTHQHAVVAGKIRLVTYDEFARRMPPARPHSPQPSLLGFLAYANTCNMAILATDFARIGGFDETFRYAEDVEHSWRAQLKGIPLVDAPEAQIWKIRRANSPEEWRQHFRWGQAHPQLFGKFRNDGLLRPPMKVTAVKYVKVIGHVLLAWLPSHRKRALRDSATRAGHLAGSIKYRVWYP
ncbi:MAG: glycosyltransferase family A protein [Actinomycetes bacterium]